MCTEIRQEHENRVFGSRSSRKDKSQSNHATEDAKLRSNNPGSRLQLLFRSTIIEKKIIETQVVSPKRGLKLSYGALVRCIRIATTSPSQWRQRELPGGAREQSQFGARYIRNTKKTRCGGFRGRQPSEGVIHHLLSKLQNVLPLLLWGGRVLKQFSGWIF